MTNNQQEFIDIIRGFDTMELNFGVVQPGAIIPYKFTYGGVNKIHCWTGSCSCTGGLLSEGPNQGQIIEGKWHIPAADVLVKNANESLRDQEQKISVYFFPDRPWFTVHTDGRRLDNADKAPVELVLRCKVDLATVKLNQNQPQPAQAVAVNPQAHHVVQGQPQPIMQAPQPQMTQPNVTQNVVQMNPPVQHEIRQVGYPQGTME